MSSVPAQFLIYVMATPQCPVQPTIQPLGDCLEVSVGVTRTFTLTIQNMCDPNVTDIADLFVSRTISGMQEGNLTASLVDPSVLYVNFTWTPQLDQVGPQQLCAVAYTE